MQDLKNILKSPTKIFLFCIWTLFSFLILKSGTKFNDPQQLSASVVMFFMVIELFIALMLDIYVQRTLSKMAALLLLAFAFVGMGVMISVKHPPMLAFIAWQIVFFVFLSIISLVLLLKKFFKPKT